MNAINERLLDLERRSTPVLVGLIGAGQMGQEILCTVQRMTGIRIPMVVDITLNRGKKTRSSPGGVGGPMPP